MRTPWLIGIVVAAHCVAVVAVVLIQGCGRTVQPLVVDDPPPPMMPPSYEEVVSEEVTPAVVPPVTPPARSWPDETTAYVVGSGDTMSGIAQRFGFSVAEISALNRITDPNRIRAGQRLVLPGNVDTSKPPPARTPAPPAPRGSIDVPPGGTAYVVKAGDSLSVIAHRHGTTVAALRKANDLTGDLIRVGQKLAIPGAAPTIPSNETRPAVTVPDGPEDAGEEAGASPVAAPGSGGAGSAGGTGLGTGLMEAPRTPGAGTPEVPYRVHVVEENEDLFAVAMMWGVSVTRIKELNGMTDSTVRVGQRLKIPTSE